MLDVPVYIQVARDSDDRQTRPLALRLQALAIGYAGHPGHAEEAVVSPEHALIAAREVGDQGPALEHEVLHSLATVYNISGSE